MASLTAEKVRGLRDKGRYGDGGGLYLYIAPGGTKSWVLRVREDGRRTDKGLGGYPAVSLTEARKAAEAYRVALRSGQQPRPTHPKARQRRAEARSLTVAEAARRVHEAKVRGGRLASPKHSRNWLQVLERHAFPAIGDMQVAQVTKRDVVELLEPIWDRLPDTARRVRQRLRATFTWALGFDLIAGPNPAGEAIEGLIAEWGRRPRAVHYSALDYQDVAAAFVTIKRSQGMRETRLAFQFLILTAARSGEVRGAIWSEIDLEAMVWTVPAERMKGGKPHRVPLSMQALWVLLAARQAIRQRRKRRPDYNADGSIYGGPINSNALVFPNPSGRPLSDNALSLRAKKDGLGCVPHGFRSSFRDWAAEQSGASREAIEMSLAHIVGGPVERAYFRSDLLEQRRRLLQAWADYVEPLPPWARGH